MQRINETLTPAIQQVLDLVSRGFMLAHSSTPAEFGNGNILTLIVPEGNERDLFTPSPFTAVTREANADDFAICRTISYVAEIGEYVGEVISWDEAMDRHPHDPADPNHTFYFSLEDGTVIDAKHGGNSSRWINHACAPNCHADEEGGRVFIRALRNIHAGEELSYDYGLVIDERYTPALKKRFECRCGARNCRGTMLAPKRASKAEKAEKAADKPVAEKAGKKAGKTHRASGASKA